MNVSSDTILEIFKAVAVDYNYTVSVSDLRNYISSHNWKFKLTKKTDSGKLYDLEFQFVKGLTEDLFWDLSHIYPDDFGKFYSGDYPEYDLGDEYETEYDNWCYFLDDLQNEMRKVKYSSKELEEFETISDSNNLKHKNMKRNDNDSAIYVVEIYNETEEFDITPMSLSHEYYNLDTAIDDLEREMESYNNDPNEIVGWVLAGEYETEDGDIYGETEAVYEISNKDYVSDSRRHVKDNDLGRFGSVENFEDYGRGIGEQIRRDRMSRLERAAYNKREAGFGELTEDEIKFYSNPRNSRYGKDNQVGDSRRRMSGRSIVSRIKDSVKAKNIRQRITDAAEKYFKKDLKNLQAYRRVTDSEGKVKENVVFLIEDSDVLAVFPNTYGTASRDRDTMVCYSHNGQHGVCTYDYANTLKTADSYDALKDELTNYVGYNLTVVDSLPSETELKQNAREIRDAYKQHKRHAITDERLLARGEEIQYNGKRGTVQYALFHGKEPVVVRWQNDEGSEEFEIPYNQVGDLKIHDSDDDSDNDIDPNVEPVDNDSDIDDAEVTDNCGGKKKTKKKTADNVKRVKITKRQTKKSE